MPSAPEDVINADIEKANAKKTSTIHTAYHILKNLNAIDQANILELYHTPSLQKIKLENSRVIDPEGIPYQCSLHRVKTQFYLVVSQKNSSKQDRSNPSGVCGHVKLLAPVHFCLSATGEPALFIKGSSWNILKISDKAHCFHPDTGQYLFANQGILQRLFEEDLLTDGTIATRNQALTWTRINPVRKHYVLQKLALGIEFLDVLMANDKDPLNRLTQLQIAYSSVVALDNDFHQKGLRHGDVKPENIMIHYWDRYGYVYYELAYIDTDFTLPIGSIVDEPRGDPLYADPDACQLNYQTDVSSDYYALGIILLSFFFPAAYFSHGLHNPVNVDTLRQSINVLRDFLQDRKLRVTNLLNELLAPASRLSKPGKQVVYLIAIMCKIKLPGLNYYFGTPLKNLILPKLEQLITQLGSSVPPQRPKLDATALGAYDFTVSLPGKLQALPVGTSSSIPAGLQQEKKPLPPPPPRPSSCCTLL